MRSLVILFQLITVLLALSNQQLAANLDPQDIIVAKGKTSELLKKPVDEDCFIFAIFGDRTGSAAQSYYWLNRAIFEVNIIMPDFVFTVGDLVEGYNTRPTWIHEMKEFRNVMERLKVPWYPVAGNHDIYWRGPGRPPEHHEADYEKHFGPLYYAFEYKDSWFIALYTDEGHPESDLKSFRTPEAQTMSDTQKNWLRETLELAKDSDHVFVFQHHPRWMHRHKYGDDWNDVHAILKEAGNVSAVFAGHDHKMHYSGEIDGIKYYTLATTGGKLNGADISEGHLQHFNLVTVRPTVFHVATVELGHVHDPELIPYTIWGKKRTEAK